MPEMEGDSFLKALWDLPLTAEEKARIHSEFVEMPVHLVARYFIPPTPQDKAATLRSFLKKLEGKERVPSNTFVTSAKDPTSKRQRAISRYKPVFVQPETMLGQADPILVALRWLYLLVEKGKVLLTHIRTARLRKIKVAEAAYYPAILCFLEAASFGQEGLHFGGEGQGNVRKSDLQGFVSSKMKVPIEVKTSVKHAKDDPTGVESNALLIGQEAEYLESTEGDEPVAMGCLFCRMDRFWLVKYLRQDGSVEVTPEFPRAQKPNETPQQLALMNPAFILMKLRDLDDSESRLGSVRLCDILPGMPSLGFSTLVAYMEQLREIHGLGGSVVRLHGAHNDDISISDLSIVAYGHKSLVMLRRSRSTVLKICLSADAGTEREIHSASDDHPNLRQLLNWGTVDVGDRQGVFRFLELDGFGEPFSAKHISDLASTEMMWNQAFEGLRHLHGKGILHRDVKPDNMLVFKGNVLKINDYDVSCFKTDRQALRRKVGTCGYHSPSSSMQPYKEEDDILSLALAFYSAKLGITKSRKGRLQILRRCLDPRLFPACMRMAVEDALRTLGQDDEDNEEEENEDEDEDDEEEG